jgi:uncharacterized protein (TIGR04255 family)
VKIEFSGGAHEEPKQELTSVDIEGLMFRSSSKPTVYQARRDGFIASWLRPYPDWETFQADAINYWERYAEAVGLPVLHSVLVKFINRMEFPLAGFSPERYLTTHPSPPPKLGWEVGNFVQQAEYLVPHTAYAVQTVLTRAFDTAPELVAFVLDIEVKLREPITATENRLGDVLRDMRKLKNRAFFGILTKTGWEGYL